MTRTGVRVRSKIEKSIADFLTHSARNFCMSLPSTLLECECARISLSRITRCLWVANS